MIAKKRILPEIFALILCFSLVLTSGCGKSAEGSGLTSNTAATESRSPMAGQSPSTQNETPRADRYEQIFDIAGDEGKLTARFLKLDSTDVDSKGAHVKSGDSSIIVSPDGFVMVIDAGAPSCGKQVVRYLKSMGVGKIDIFVASHPHIDHIGGFPDVADEFDIGLVYMSRVEYPTSTYYKNFISALEKHRIPFQYLAEGDEFDFGEMVHVTVFNPPAEFTYPEKFPSDSTEFLNNMSIMMRIEYEQSTILFAGDLYKAAEKRILEAYGDLIQSDIVKGNHHGAETSNIFDWVTTVRPNVTAMMYEGVASELVYKRYTSAGSKVYITAIDGCIKVTADGAGNYTWLTQFDRQNNILD